MASETPGDRPFDATSNSPPATSDNSTSQQTLPSVWRTDWEWVVLAWLGGLFVGSMLLWHVLLNEIAAGYAAVIGGAVIMMIAPGACATLQVWSAHRKSAGKSRLQDWR